MSDHTKELFDRKASSWHLKYSHGGSLTARLVGVVDAIGPPNSRQLLDLGCASGSIAAALSERGFHATGCDISHEMVVEARQRHGDVAVFCQADGMALPFPNQRFDVVSAVSVLEYVSDLDAVLFELRRVVRPGGTLIATVPNTRHPIRWIEEALDRLLPGGAPPQGSSPPSPSSKARDYRAYLSASRQRLSPRRWTATLERTGFTAVTAVPFPSRHTMLLLTARA